MIHKTVTVAADVVIVSLVMVVVGVVVAVAAAAAMVDAVRRGCRIETEYFEQILY